MNAFLYLLTLAVALLSAPLDTPSTARTDNTPANVLNVTAQQDPYAAERQKIDEAVQRINSRLNSYEKKSYNTEFDGKYYQLIRYFNKDGVVIKVEARGDQDQWYFYTKALNKKDNKVIYAIHATNKAKPITTYYSIGSMIKGPSYFVLAIDSKGHPINDEPALTTAEQRYDAAFLAFNKQP